MTDQRYYEIVGQELQRRVLHAGLWARAVAETGDEGATARALYIRLRVAELVQEEQAESIRAHAEASRRAAEEARNEEMLSQTEALAREKDDRRLAAEIEAERSRCDELEAASPYTSWIAFGCVILALCLLIWLMQLVGK